MGNKRLRPDFRLGGKEIFVGYRREDKEKGFKEKSFACTNMVLLSENTGIDYNTFVRAFTRHHQLFLEDIETGYIFIRLRVDDISKGRQRFSVQGKGSGMLFNGTLGRRNY